MVWDPTGEESVYSWNHYFYDKTSAQKTIDRIQGHMRIITHWGWNGNAGQC